MTEIILPMIHGTWAELTYRTTALAISRLMFDQGRKMLFNCSNGVITRSRLSFLMSPPWINKARDGYAHSISRDRYPKFQFSFIGSLQMCLNPLTGKRRGRRTKLNHPTSWSNCKNGFFSATCLAVQVKQAPLPAKLYTIRPANFSQRGGDFFYFYSLS